MKIKWDEERLFLPCSLPLPLSQCILVCTVESGEDDVLEGFN